MGLALILNLYLASQRALTNATESLVDNATMATELLAQSMSGLVYNYQSDEAKRLANDFLQYSQFNSVRIVDTRNRVFTAASKSPQENVFNVARPVIGLNGEPLGRLEVSVSRDGIEAATRASFIHDSILGSGLILLTLIVVYFGTSQMVTALARARDEMHDRAQTDPQTGLLNRRGVQARMNEALALKPGQHFGLIQIDLDHFKEVNDTFGHAVGDNVLVEVAARMRAVAREGDLLARIGGDEFLVITTIDDEPSAATLDYACMLVDAIKQPMPESVTPRSPGASAGVCEFALTSQDDLDRAMVRADLALYGVKRGGRGRALAYHDDMRNKFMRHEGLAAEIDLALANDEFAPWFQPQVRMSTGQLEGLEALVRWERLDGTVGEPSAFLDVAHQHGYLGRIDERVFDKATDTLAELHKAGLDHVTLSINLSVARLDDPDLCHSFCTVLQRKGLTPSHIALELLETALLDQANEQAMHMVSQLALAGFRIELDDFGSGHSSIANLANLPVSRIKIDRQFVSGVNLDQRKQIALRATTDLGRRFGVQLLAEGIETQDEWDIVKRTGVEIAQGYFVAHPMNYEQLLRWCMGSEMDLRINAMRSVVRREHALGLSKPSVA